MKKIAKIKNVIQVKEAAKAKKKTKNIQPLKSKWGKILVNISIFGASQTAPVVRNSPSNA